MSSWKSPFPGMDPFLEVNPRWKGFHGWFIRELARLTLPLAADYGCWVDVERSVYQREPTGEMVLLGEPDVFVDPNYGAANWERVGGGTAVALAEPQAVHEIALDPDLLEQYKQDYLVIRENNEYRAIVAVIELLSFANKEGSYVPKYREKRSRFVTSGAHFLEIDFLREGDNPSRQLFPELPPTPYFLFLARKSGAARHEMGFPIRLQDRLPTIGIPIRPGKPELPLDLQVAFDAAYSLSVRPRLIDYAKEIVPGPPLTPEDAEWVRQIVQRTPQPS